jgi:hypothetical protein
LRKQVAVERIVGILEKRLLAPVATLGDMIGDAR